MGHRPREANSSIKILNSKTKDELAEFKITDRTKTILEVRRALTKRNLLVQLENKCQHLEASIQKFNVLHLKGLPGLKGIGNKLVQLTDYQQNLYSIAQDKSKFSTIKGTITGKSSLEALEFDLLIKAKIKHLFLVKLNFQKYTEEDETYRNLVKMLIQDEERWYKLCQLLKQKEVLSSVIEKHFSSPNHQQ